MNIAFPSPIGRRLWSADELQLMLRAGILTEDDRIELIGGEIVTMAAKGAQHEILRNELVLNWADRRPRDVKFATEAPLRLAPREEPEPDITLFPANLHVPDVRGDTALLVVEIADSSLSYDLKIKAPLYATYGVRECWVIDTETLVTTVHRQPDQGAYQEVTEVPPSALLTPLAVPALAVRLADLPLGRS